MTSLTCTTTLFVRHLPSDLEDAEKVDLLCHFGADSVRTMGTQGAMKHTAFVTFTSPELASQALKRLHQLEILGHKLVVEYAKLDQQTHYPTGNDSERPETKQTDPAKPEPLPAPVTDKDPNEDTTYKTHSIPYPRKPSLHYVYPPPTVSTLTNIANALASSPRFYTQVLHLMNKMHLPCPFGVVTPSPPLAMETNTRGQMITTQGHMISERQHGYFVTGSRDEITEVQMEYLSTEESEIESEDEEIRKKRGRNEVGRTGVKQMKRPRKRMKLIQPDMSMMIKPVIAQNPGDVFDTAETPRHKDITFNISAGDVTSNLRSGVTHSTEHTSHRQAVTTVNTADVQTTAANTPTVVEGGFGKVEPIPKQKTVEELNKPEVNYKIVGKDFIPLSDITAGRLKPDQMKDFSVFKNYKPGEVTCRLYIKNLTKQTMEQDLLNLFGSFIGWDEAAYNSFDIRVMKEGRMKGQAFVTLPNETCARDIVDNCNGYIMNNKPIVIQYARSAKAKQVDTLVE